MKRLLLLLALLCASSAEAMVALNATTESLELETTAAVSVDWSVLYTDYVTATPSFTPASGQGNVATATTTTIVAAPGASTHRLIKAIRITNRSTTTAQTVRLKKDVSTVEYWLGPSITLAAGEHLLVDAEGVFAVYDAVGRRRQANEATPGFTGRPATLYKTGSAPDATGYWYCSSKDAGFPGAWAPGTPGVAGRATDGTAAGDAGCILWQNPASGGMFMTRASIVSSTAHWHELMDVVWVNSGLVVTTTTAQTINSVAFPARDVNGSTNGDGFEIALLIVATTTNAAVINNSIVTYTNEAGTGSRTATLVAQVGAQIPATALIGTIVWFRLQAGDKGVRSIQSITLNTSLGAGTISLLVARRIVSVPTTVANVGVQAFGLDNPGIRLYSGTCLLHQYLASATTITLIGGTFSFMER